MVHRLLLNEFFPDCRMNKSLKSRLRKYDDLTVVCLHIVLLFMFTYRITLFQLSNFIEFLANFSNHLIILAFSSPANHSNMIFAKSVGFELPTWPKFWEVHADWLVPNETKTGLENSHKCNNYIAANCPGSTYVSTDVNHTICTASKFNQSKSRKSVFRQQINFCFV